MVAQFVRKDSNVLDKMPENGHHGPDCTKAREGDSIKRGRNRSGVLGLLSAQGGKGARLTPFHSEDPSFSGCTSTNTFSQYTLLAPLELLLHVFKGLEPTC